MAGVFISYRRDDSAGFAGALERELAARLGRNRVFMDIKDIEGGTEFPAAINEALKSSDVVIALIGGRWLDARDEQGVRRLDKPDDFVRREVARALTSKARVIPLLLDGTRLPGAEQLPGDLQPLTTRQALELRNSHWDEDFTKLMNHVREGLFALDTGESADTKLGADFDPIGPGSTRFNMLLYGVLAMGAIFAFIGLGFSIRQAIFLAHAAKADARVVGLQRELSHQDDGSDHVYYYPQLEYVNPDEQTVRVTLSTGSNPPAYFVGEHLAILFDPHNPARVAVDSFWGRWDSAVIFGGVSIVICNGGAIPFALRYRRRHQIQRLLKTGIPILTAFHSVEQNTTVEVNGRHPFSVITQWRNPVSHDLVWFRSPALWQDPTAKAGAALITVVVDPDNFRRYVMDLSFMARTDARMRRL